VIILSGLSPSAFSNNNMAFLVITALFFAGIILAKRTKFNLRITARIPVMCSFIAISGVNFGTYTGDEIYSNGALDVSCDFGTIYNISLGQGGSGTYSPRQMNNSESGLLNYNLYIDGTYATIWGDGTGGTGTVGGTGTGGTQNYPVYGRAFAGQNVPVGTYTDSILVTIDY